MKGKPARDRVKKPESREAKPARRRRSASKAPANFEPDAAFRKEGDRNAKSDKPKAKPKKNRDKAKKNAEKTRKIAAATKAKRAKKKSAE
nr:hypothetical protein PJ912_07595 [Pectobacterium colocasium]